MKTIGITVAGVFLVLLGIVLLFLPGPGVICIVLGLGLLAQRHRAAKAALHRARVFISARARDARLRQRESRGN